jgi:hypothetical protein
MAVANQFDLSSYHNCLAFANLFTLQNFANFAIFMIFHLLLMHRVFHRFIENLRDNKKLAYVAFSIIGLYIYFQVNGFVYLVYWISSLVLSTLSDVFLAIHSKKCADDVLIIHHHHRRHKCHKHCKAVNPCADEEPESCDSSEHLLDPSISDQYRPITVGEELSVLLGQFFSISISFYVNYLLTYGYLVNPLSYNLMNYLGSTNMFSSSTSGISMGAGNLYNNPSMNQQSSLTTSIDQSNSFNAMVNNSTAASKALLQDTATQGPLGPLTPIQAAAVAASLNTPAIANPYLDPYCSSGTKVPIPALLLTTMAGATSYMFLVL